MYKCKTKSSKPGESYDAATTCSYNENRDRDVTQETK